MAAYINSVLPQKRGLGFRDAPGTQWEAEAKKTARLLVSSQQRDDEDLFDMVTSNMRVNNGVGLHFEVNLCWPRLGVPLALAE
jgi:hypothetical protein